MSVLFCPFLVSYKSISELMAIANGPSFLFNNPGRPWTVFELLADHSPLLFFISFLIPAVYTLISIPNIINLPLIA